MVTRYFWVECLIGGQPLDNGNKIILKRFAVRPFGFSLQVRA